MPTPRTVALVTLGCARNEVDSEELAGRLEADGWTLVEDPAEADVAVVNTCGFVDAAKKDSIDTVLAATDLKDGGRTRAVVAVGCLAERYGDQLAAALPEADAVLGFDEYERIGDRLRTVLAGGHVVAHTPRDRRALLPLTPVDRRAAAATLAIPGHGVRAAPAADDRAEPPPLPDGPGPRPVRRRLQNSPVAPLKLASGCDRRCAFCAIPSFRGSFLSRRPAEILAEARWLAQDGVRELTLVSENSTSYGKDLGDLRLLEALLPELAAVEGIERIRVSYLQPAEMRPSLIAAIADTPRVAPYFDLSFQHAAAGVLRRMRRFGDTERFWDLVERVRAAAPDAGIRSNVIVGFPGETEADVAELERFLDGARLDAIGVFGYSDEEGTEAAGYGDKVDPAIVAERVERVTTLAEELTAQRAEDRKGEEVEVLVERVDWAAWAVEGSAAHQAPDADGATLVRWDRAARDRAARGGAVWGGATWPAVGDIVRARVVASDGVDLVAEPSAVAARPGAPGTAPGPAPAHRAVSGSACP